MMEYKRQFRQYNFPSRWLRQLLEREAFFRRGLLSMNYWQSEQFYTDAEK